MDGDRAVALGLPSPPDLTHKTRQEPFGHDPTPDHTHPTTTWHHGRVARRSTRSQLYRAARDLGNVEAALKGPGAYSKRAVRRRAYRVTNRELARTLKLFRL